MRALLYDENKLFSSPPPSYGAGREGQASITDASRFQIMISSEEGSSLRLSSSFILSRMTGRNYEALAQKSCVTRIAKTAARSLVGTRAGCR